MRKVRTIIALLLLLAGVVSGFTTIKDPDFGWHLAGGLWILDTFQVPQQDPFAAGSNYWLCYSWLFEVLIGAVFNLAGFPGLLLLKAILVFFHVTVLLYYIRLLNTDKDHVSFPRLELAEAILILFLLLLHAPIWNLRPQSLGMLFLLLVLIRWERRALTALFVLPLTILWANIHIFWVLVPAIIFLERVVFPPDQLRCRRMQGLFFCIAASAAGLITPYSFAGIKGMVQYALQHQAANDIIFEIQPLSIVHGEVFWSMLLLTVASLLFIRSIFKCVGASQAILFFIMLLAAWSKIRFILVFSVFAVPILAKVLLPIVCGFFNEKVSKRTPALPPFFGLLTPRSGLLHLAIAAGLIFLAGQLFFAEEPITEAHQELLFAADNLGKAVGPHKEVVFNDFNDGGWLILAFWLHRSWEKPENNLKVAIDGRTLVQGGQRIQEYRQIRDQSPGWQSLFKEWGPSIVFLKSGNVIEKHLLAADQQEIQIGNWQIFYRGSVWTVLRLNQT